MNQNHVIHHMSADDFLHSHAGEQIYVEAGQTSVVNGEQVTRTYFATARFIDGNGHIHCYHPHKDSMTDLIYDDAPGTRQRVEKMRLKAEQAGNRLFYYITSTLHEMTPRRGLVDIGNAAPVAGEPVPDLSGVDDR